MPLPSVFPRAVMVAAVLGASTAYADDALPDPAALKDVAAAAPAVDAAPSATVPSATPPSATPPSAPAVEPKLRLDDLPPPALGMSEFIGPLVKTFVMLGVVLGLVYLTLHKGVSSLVARQNLGKRVKLVERVALDAKRSVYLLDVDGRQLLIGGGDQGVVLLKELDAVAVSEAPASTIKPLTFFDVLKRKPTSSSDSATSGVQA